MSGAFAVDNSVLISYADNINKREVDASTTPKLLGKRTDPRAVARRRREIINFLIGLSQTEAAVLLSPERRGDLLNLARDLLHFGLAKPHKDVPPAKRIEATAFIIRGAPDRFQDVIASLRKLLSAIADGKEFLWELGEKSLILDAGALKSGDPTNPSIYFWPITILEQSVIIGAMLELASAEGAMVRRCSRHVCGRVFLAARPKQVFCTRQCASAAVFERYKENLGEEEYRAKHREVMRRWSRKKRYQADKQRKDAMQHGTQAKRR